MHSLWKVDFSNVGNRCDWVLHVNDTYFEFRHIHLHSEFAYIHVNPNNIFFPHWVIVARLHMLPMQTISERWSHPNPQLKPLMTSSFWPEVLLADCPRVPVLKLNTQGALNHSGLFICFCTLSSAEGSTSNCTTCVFRPILGMGFMHCKNYRLDASGLCWNLASSGSGRKWTLSCDSGNQETCVLRLSTFAGLLGDLQLFHAPSSAVGGWQRFPPFLWSQILSQML